MQSIAKMIHRPPLEKLVTCDKHGEYTAHCHVGTVWTKCQSCCEEEKQAEEKARIAKSEADALAAWKAKVEGSGIPERFREAKFSTYKADTAAQKAVLDAAKGYAYAWEENRSKGRSLILVGSVGAGKNHIACSIAKHVMYHHKATVLFRTADQAVRMVKDTWVRGCERSASDVMADMIKPDLFILDEIEDLSDYDKRIIFEVMNERYLAKKPCIILGNTSIEQLKRYLGERVMDRLSEDGGEILSFSWESARPKIGRGEM